MIFFNYLVEFFIKVISYNFLYNNRLALIMVLYLLENSIYQNGRDLDMYNAPDIQPSAMGIAQFEKLLKEKDCEFQDSKKDLDSKEKYYLKNSDNIELYHGYGENIKIGISVEQFGIKSVKHAKLS